MTMLNNETKNQCPKLLLLQYPCSHVTCNVTFLAVHLQLCRLPSTHDHHLKSFLSVFPESQWKNVILGGWNFFNHLFGNQVGFWHMALTVWVFEASLPDWFCLTWAKSIWPYATVLCTERSYLPPFDRELFHSIHLTTTKGRAGIVVVEQGGHVGISLKDCSVLKPIFQAQLWL